MLKGLEITLLKANTGEIKKLTDNNLAAAECNSLLNYFILHFNAFFAELIVIYIK